MSTLLAIIALAFALALGAYLGIEWERRRPKKQTGIQLLMSIQVDATREIAIKVVGRDKEGNAIDLTGKELTLTIEPTNDKEIGSVNDTNDTFNPGEAGATGVLKGTVDIDGVTHEASVELELVPGALSEISLDFKPVEENAGGDDTQS